jgi:putative ABC transport system permease protein
MIDMIDGFLLALARRALPSADREWMAGDLEEDFQRLVHTEGRWRARGWLIGESLRNFSRRTSNRPRSFKFKVKSMSWIDLKLGLRMLVKYPGLTLVGGTAMAFAIFIGVVAFTMFSVITSPTLPIKDADRVVRIRSFDVAKNQAEPKQLHDFKVWRDSLRSVTDLGAWQDSSRNLIIPGVETSPIPVAEMSAIGFQVAEGEPHLGRVLTDADADPAAAPVVVIGYEIWKTRFGSDPSVIGKTVQLGDDHPVVVGVMREGFEFPVAHDAWVPLRLQLLDAAPRGGRATSVFGRLAPGQTVDTARAELNTIAKSLARDLPLTHQHLEPRVAGYADPDQMGTDDSAFLYAIYFFLTALLTLICGNVGLLIFARAASRESDLIVRTALGAGRSRIVWQLFTEALVLAVVSAGVGIVAGSFFLRTWGTYFLEVNFGRLPFWIDLAPSMRTIVFAAASTVFGAAVAGVIPAFKLTRGMSDRLKQTSAGSGGAQFGGVWTFIIVAQIAVTMMFPAIVYGERMLLTYTDEFEVGFAAEQFLTARIDKDAGSSPERFARSLNEVQTRLASTSGVTGVAYAQALPATWHPWQRIELQGADGAVTLDYGSLAPVSTSYFEALDSPAIDGRTFTAADVLPGSRVAIVDEAFVEIVLKGRNPIGQRVRFAPKVDGPAPPPEPWYDIVGLVKELGVSSPDQKERAAGLYLPAPPERLAKQYLMVHVPSGDAAAFGPRLREVVTSVDSTLKVSEILRADQVNDDQVWAMSLWVRITSVMSGLAIMLSLAGIYAVLSFTVTRRTREIGVRVALGGSRERVIGAILRRPLIRVAFGVLLGSSMVLAAMFGLRTTEFPGADAPLTVWHFVTLIVYVAVMVVVCSMACIVPAQRALRVEPTVALRAE